jgi:hypothetical protein
VAFRDHIRDEIRRCAVQLVLIGPTWGTAVDSAGRPRLGDPADVVVLEIREALRAQIRVIPVLHDGAVMPNPWQLPPDLQALTARHAVQLRDAASFRTDASALLGELDRLVLPVRPQHPRPLRPLPDAPRHRYGGWLRSLVGLAVFAVAIALVVTWGGQVGAAIRDLVPGPGSLGGAEVDGSPGAAASATGDGPWTAAGSTVTLTVLPEVEELGPSGRGLGPEDERSRLRLTLRIAALGEELDGASLIVSDQNGTTLQQDLFDSELVNNLEQGEEREVRIVVYELPDREAETLSVSIKDFFWSSAERVAVNGVPVPR